jgi:methylenetetrahydrofolate--tRNA-(uracil-5-)-methyltransferase
MGSLLVRSADETAVPAGGALAVDRVAFARRVTEAIEGHPGIELVREEVRAIPDGPCVIASGPLTSSALSGAIAALTGSEHLYFFDAISPIVDVESIDFTIAFRDNRYGRGEDADGDYINCPLDREEYERFVEALAGAERIVLKEFETVVESGVRAGLHEYFEGCLPVEVLAGRGPKTLAFGPLRPVGLTDPRTGKRPHAVVQLRQDNLAGTLYNLVGFQTNLTFPEQRRVFRLIPGLGEAQFERFGQMHRNTFIYSPALLEPTLQFKGREDLFFAGQITGVEGYAGNIGTGLLAGVNAARVMAGEAPAVLPAETMLGALCWYVTHAEAADFQPMKANFGILPVLEDVAGRGRRERAGAYSERGLAVLDATWAAHSHIVDQVL